MVRLKAGDTAPGFSLTDQNGNTVSLSGFRGGKALVYFYPKANTSGCAKQACSIRDAEEDLHGIDIEVLGLSPDPPEKLKKFDEKHGLGFTLLSDAEHATAELYGVWGEKKMYGKTYMGIVRSSFLIDEAGKVIDAWYKVRPLDTVPKAMKALESYGPAGAS